MTPTAVFVEQVLIGSILVAILVLPIHPEIGDLVKLWKSDSFLFDKLAVGAILLGIVYLMGVVADRLADTILEIWERHIRLRFAIKKYDSWPQTWVDPYDEGRYRVLVLKYGGAMCEWMDYLRRRVRLVRSLAIYLPGLTISLQAALLRTACRPDHSLPESLAGLGVALNCSEKQYGLAYLGILILVVYLIVPLFQGVWRSIVKYVTPIPKVWDPPRTNDPEEEIDDYASRRGLKRDGGKLSRQKSIQRRWFVFMDVCLGVPFILFAVFSFISLQLAELAGLSVVGTKWNVIDWVGVTGGALTILSAWAWWRVLTTYFTYMEMLGKSLDEKPAGEDLPRKYRFQDVILILPK